MENNLTFNSEPLPFNISFHDKSNKIVGKFIINDGKLDFEGDATESAKIFIDQVLTQYNNGV